MKDKNRKERFRFKVGLRGQQVVLFLLVALMPLFAISLAIKVLGENALKGTVGENHVLLAQEKLARVDSAISEKIAKIEAELPNTDRQLLDLTLLTEKSLYFFIFGHSLWIVFVCLKLMPVIKLR